jgi:hypothetical protein
MRCRSARTKGSYSGGIAPSEPLPPRGSPAGRRASAVPTAAGESAEPDPGASVRALPFGSLGSSASTPPGPRDSPEALASGKGTARPPSARSLDAVGAMRLVPVGDAVAVSRAGPCDPLSTGAGAADPGAASSGAGLGVAGGKAAGDNGAGGDAGGEIAAGGATAEGSTAAGVATGAGITGSTPGTDSPGAADGTDTAGGCGTSGVVLAGLSGPAVRTPGSAGGLSDDRVTADDGRGSGPPRGAWGRAMPEDGLDVSVASDRSRVATTG